MGKNRKAKGYVAVYTVIILAFCIFLEILVFTYLYRVKNAYLLNADEIEFQYLSE